jgi:hypothetical protein
MTESDINADLPVPPVCRPMMDRLQLVLDGALPAAALDADAHAVACPACRARVAAARLVLSALAAPGGFPIPSSLTDGILSAVREDRHTRIRRRSYAVAVGVAVALAASLLLVGWLGKAPTPEPFVPEQASDVAHVAPEPRPVRIGDEFAKVGQALLGSSRPITEPVAGAPRALAGLTDVLTRPPAPGTEFEPARKSLAELPDAARAGLEPVTGTAEKAFARLMRDIGAVQVSKPKS